MKTALRVGKCLIRFSKEEDLPELERIYLAHEGISLPKGYFETFRWTIRDDAVFYFVAEIDGKVIGGGGISNYLPGHLAQLTFGIVDPRECGKGYGTALILARLVFVDPDSKGCQIAVEATEWSAGFFARLGFSWYHDENDEAGDHFLYGSHSVLPGDDRVFLRLLRDNGVTLDFEPDRGSSTNFSVDSGQNPSGPP